MVSKRVFYKTFVTLDSLMCFAIHPLSTPSIIYTNTDILKIRSAGHEEQQRVAAIPDYIRELCGKKQKEQARLQ